MKIQWKKLIICLFIPLAIGSLSAFLTKDNIQLFQLINKPTLSPPSWIFPIVWTILYILMGIASYLVWTMPRTNNCALIFYLIQLGFNFFWTIIFFNFKLYLFAFIWLLLMWLLILKTTLLFYQTSKPAGYLMLPYLLWVSFAGYLNFSIYLLN